MKTFNPTQFTKAPQQIQKVKFINAPIKEVWTILADHQGMTQWMPMIKEVHLVKADAQGEWGEGCERQCQFGPDLLEEKIVHWDQPHGYAYMISDMHLVKNHLGHIKLEEKNGGTLVTWTQYFDPNGNFLKRLMAKQVMMPKLMSKALNNLDQQLAA